VASRRSNGIGTLTERPTGSGKWRWRVRLGVDPVTGEPRRLSRTIEAKTRSAAEKQARQILAELEAEPVGSEAPMSKVFAEWMRHCEARGRSPHTLDWNRRAVANVIGPAIGDVPLNELSPRHLDHLYDELIAKPLSPPTVRRYHAVISAALTQAKKWGWIDSNPAERATVPEPTHKALVVPTPDEIREIISALEEVNPVYGLAAYLAARTGLRRGELCALKWADWADGVIDVSASLYRVRGETGTKGTKTGRERLIRTTSDVDFALGQRRNDADAIAASAGCELGPDAYILSSWPDGSQPVNPDSLSSAFSRTAKHLGMAHVHFHSLRHFAATEMLAAGVSPQDAAGVLGHVNPTMTLNVYAHSTAERQRAAMEAIGKALNP